MAVEAAAATPAPASETRNPLVSSNFRYWWLASILGGAGVGIPAVTIQLFLRDRVHPDDRALAFAAATISLNLIGAAFALIGGVAADRTERRRILVRTYGTVALVSTAFVVMSAADIRAIWPVYPLLMIVGAAGAFTNPARQAMIPQMLTRAQIQNGVILGTVGFMAMLQVGGPFLGAFIADAVSLTAAFTVEVVVLALAALLFSRIAVDRPVPTGRSVRGDLIDGLRYIKTEPTILSLLCLGFIPGIFLMGPFTVTVLIFVEDIFAASDRYVGIFWGCFGGGIVIGSILMTIRPLPWRGTAVLLCIIAGGVFFLAYGVSQSIWFSMVVLVIFGITGPAIFINTVVALIQEYARPEMMGRVMSMYGLAFTASVPLGALQAGIVASQFGPRATVVSSAIACLVVGLACLVLMRPVRRLR
jgi:MFS transporter, ENTS family, enterobactin (siderophore) exporter